MSALASRATVSLINNKGDLGKVFKELGSSQFVKSLATSMLTAGLTAGLPSDILPLQEAGLSANALPFVERLQNNLVNSLVSTSVETAIQGGSFGDNLVNSLRNVGVNQLLAVTDKYVGDITDGANKLPVANLIAHTIVGGLAAEATGGKFVTGAAAGLASAIAAQSGVFNGLSPTDIAKVSQLIGGAAALLAGGDGRDVNQGAATSQSAALNNYLTHAQISELTQKLKDCRGQSGCEGQLFALYNNMSIANSEAMQSCGLDNVCVAYHLRLIGEASQSANELFSTASYNSWFRESLKIYQTSDLNRGIATYRYNEHLESVCPGLQSGCIAVYKVKQGALTIADFLPLIGDTKAFVDAYRSGSGWEWAAAIIGIAPAAGDGLGKLLKAGKLDGLARAEFDKLPEVAGLTKGQLDAAYVEFVLKGGGLSSSGLATAARLDLHELETGIRLEKQLVIKLTESPHIGAEYVDELGRSYDALGKPGASKFWNSSEFFGSINDHLLKANNFTVIDLTAFTQQQKTEVAQYLATLSAEKNAKIIKVGF